MSDPDLYVCDCREDNCTGMYKRVHAAPEHLTVDGVELRHRTAGELGLCGNSDD